MPIIGDSLTWLYLHAYRLELEYLDALCYHDLLHKLHEFTSKPWRPSTFAPRGFNTFWQTMTSPKNAKIQTWLLFFHGPASELEVAITFSIKMKTKCSLLSQSIAQTARSHFHRTKGFITDEKNGVGIHNLDETSVDHSDECLSRILMKTYSALSMIRRTNKVSAHNSYETIEFYGRVSHKHTSVHNSDECPKFRLNNKHTSACLRWARAHLQFAFRRVFVD